MVPSEKNWKGRSVLITGVCGTIGQELLRELSGLGCQRIILGNLREILKNGKSDRGHRSIQSPPPTEGQQKGTGEPVNARVCGHSPIVVVILRPQRPPNGLGELLTV